MTYIDKQYVPTVWENEVTLIDSIKMNKIESALSNFEYAESLRFGTLRRTVLPMASIQESDDLSVNLVGAVQLSNRHTPGGVAMESQKHFSATPYAVSQAYMNSAAIDLTTPSARIAKESVVAQKLKEAVSLSFVGGHVSGNQLDIETSGSALSANLVVIKDGHQHSTKSIEAQATSSTKGFVKLADDFVTIETSEHSDIVPTAKLFKDKVVETNQAITSESNRINTANSKINNILTATNIDGTSYKVAVDNANSAKLWVDNFTAPSGGKLAEIEQGIVSLTTGLETEVSRVSSALATNKKILDLSSDISDTKLHSDVAKGVLAKAWVDAASAADGVITTTVNEVTALKQGVATNTQNVLATLSSLQSMAALVEDLEERIAILEG